MVKRGQVRNGVLAILVSTLGFSFYPIFGKYVFAGGASLATVLFVRFLLAAVVFWLIVLWQEGVPRLRRGTLLQLWRGPTTASILSTMEPVLTVFLAVMILGEGLVFLQTIGALFVVAGAILAAWLDKRNLSSRREAM